MKLCLSVLIYTTLSLGCAASHGSLHVPSDHSSAVTVDSLTAQPESLTADIAVTNLLLEIDKQVEQARLAATHHDFATAQKIVNKAMQRLMNTPNTDDAIANDAKEEILRKLARVVLAIHEKRVFGSKRKVLLVNNNRVQREIQYFAGPNAEFLRRAYERSGLYAPDIRRILEGSGLPADLIWLPLLESGYNPQARSHMSAVGLWQFIPGTARRYQLSQDAWIDERMDPIASTKAAVAYLQELFDLFGDFHLVLAAYNCGEGRVLQAINQQNTFDFWKLDLPLETMAYVPKFIAILTILASPDQYGIRLPKPMAPPSSKVVVSSKRVALNEMAKAFGVAPADLVALNPQLRLSVTPPHAFVLRIPKDADPEALNRLPERSDNTLVESSGNYYDVRPGDTLFKISKRFKSSPKQLKTWNHLSGNTVTIGQRLLVKKATKKKSPSKGRRTYKVKPGDTLSGIAHTHNVPISVLKSLNRLRRQNLKVGQKLALP